MPVVALEQALAAALLLLHSRLLLAVTQPQSLQVLFSTMPPLLLALATYTPPAAPVINQHRVGVRLEAPHIRPVLGRHSQHQLLDSHLLAAVEAHLVVEEERLGQYSLLLVPQPQRLALRHLEQPQHLVLVTPLQPHLRLVKQEPLAPAHPHLVPLQVGFRLYCCL